MRRSLRFFKAIVKWALSGFKVDRKLARERISICNICEYNARGICALCGCVLKAKTKLKTESCPIDKW